MTSSITASRRRSTATARDVTVAELAALMKETVEFNGRIDVDCSNPDGAPRKLVDTIRISGLGWAPQRDLRSGLAETYAWVIQKTLSSRPE